MQDRAFDFGIGMVAMLSLAGVCTRQDRLSDALRAAVAALIGKVMLRSGIPGFPPVIALGPGPISAKPLAVAAGSTLPFTNSLIEDRAHATK